ncbi:hypothetical protein [Streptacidiphilus sp. MAP12-33]|uniref:hypothetical protein n=1 Tax=Streptacidiphilus sp. MAP12-33 TaxID=3156266 RepID=UPI00351960CB
MQDTYTEFLDPAVPLRRKEELLQDAPDLDIALRGFTREGLATPARVAVTRIHFISDTSAVVTYDVCARGLPAQPQTEGMAQLQAGSWKVAAATFCSLLQQGRPHAAATGCD